VSLVFLWTDALLWLLVLAAVIYFLYVRRHEHLSAPWTRLTHSGPAMACLCILALYLAVALLDSIHYHPPLASSDAARPAGVFGGSSQRPGRFAGAAARGTRKDLLGSAGCAGLHQGDHH